ncbi:MAG: FMN-binding protein [Treponema sp.]|nr:FMN-binding protein [Treponema sp.]
MSDANVEKKTGKEIWGMIKLGLILVAYAVASCAVLALVNYFTEPVIARNAKEKAMAAMKVVYSQADDFTPAEITYVPSNKSIKLTDMYVAKKDGKAVGAVIQVEGPTYDSAKIMVGLTKDGTVTGLEFLENHDSPSFGLNASSSTYTVANGKTFYGQFAGLKAADGFEVNKNFDAITGATITSRAVGNLVTEGCNAMNAVLKELGDE